MLSLPGEHVQNAIMRCPHLLDERSCPLEDRGRAPCQKTLLARPPGVLCRPKGVTEFKFGYIQWLAIFITLAAAFAWFESSLFTSRALDTYCTYDVHKSQIRSHGPVGLR